MKGFIKVDKVMREIRKKWYDWSWRVDDLKKGNVVNNMKCIRVVLFDFKLFFGFDDYRVISKLYEIIFSGRFLIEVGLSGLVMLYWIEEWV